MYAVTGFVVVGFFAWLLWFGWAVFGESVCRTLSGRNGAGLI